MSVLDGARIFDLHLQRAYLRAVKLAAAAKEPWDPPGWAVDQLAEVERALAQAGRAPAMAALASRAGLDPVAEDLLWSLAAATIEPRAHPHLAAALGAELRRGISLGSYAALAELDAAGSRSALDVLDREHPLLRHGLLEPADDRLNAATSLAVPRRVIDHLAGRDSLDPALAACGGLVWPPASPRLDDRQRGVLERLEDAVGSPLQALILVEGPAGAGRTSAAAIAADALERQVVALDAERVRPVAADCERALAALHREALLRGAVPLVANADAWMAHASGAEDLRRVLVGFARAQPGATILTTRPGAADLPGDLPVVRLPWDVADHATRYAVWCDLLVEEAPELQRELGGIAHRYRLGPGGIERAVRSAWLLAGPRGGPGKLTAHDLVMGVRSNIAERLRALAHRIEIHEGWDDLVLPADALEAITRLIARVRYAHRVYEDWGFKRRMSRGIGVPALFSGPPGTGKTMVAGLIARELDLELFQIDLSQIVSKWVGETEKNLGQVFEAAEAGHALLLFDEADALFAKRSSDVRGAQDRYANLEVNYLLQRIEAFSGIAILTTNLDTSIDNALKRRLAAHVIFYPPDEAERAQLWQRMVSSGRAPVACAPADFQRLAREFADMSGAHIRNAVLAAAFMAAAEGGTITRDHLARAAQTEYRSMGRVLSG